MCQVVGHTAEHRGATEVGDLPEPGEDHDGGHPHRGSGLHIHDAISHQESLSEIYLVFLTSSSEQAWCRLTAVATVPGCMWAAQHRFDPSACPRNLLYHPHMYLLYRCPGHDSLTDARLIGDNE
jgi:hypothetical protein